MKESFEGPGEDDQLHETRERLARKKLGQIALSSFPSLSEELSKKYDTDDGLPEGLKSSDYSAIKKRVLQLDKEDQDSLKESLKWPTEQRRLEYEKYIDTVPADQLHKASIAAGILNYDFSNYNYPKRWLDIREALLSTIAAPDQGTHHADNTDKHTKSLANALTSAIINLNISEDTLKRASGILTSEHLPDFAKQMSIFQLIYPISELDLEFTGDYGSFHGEKRTVASGKKHWGKIGSPVLISLIQQQ